MTDERVSPEINHLDPSGWTWAELRDHLLAVHNRPPEDHWDVRIRRHAADVLHEEMHAMEDARASAHDA